MSTIAAFSRM